MTDIAAHHHRPRRSCLYMPGANARALEKAASLAADVLVLDLEDAVLPEAKAEARARVADKVVQRQYGGREVWVRVNALDTPWGRDDVSEIVESGPDGVLIPKIATAAEVFAADALFDEYGASPTMGLWVMIETPLAVLNLQQIAAASADSRLRGFVVGTNDLAKEMMAQPGEDRLAFHHALSQTVMAARAYGLIAIDGVFNDIGNDSGLQRESEQGRAFGFDGKSLIHPSQLAIANRVFAPDAVQLAHAHDVIAAFADPDNTGKGVLRVNGKMTEVLHIEQARALVQKQMAIDALAHPAPDPS